MAGIRRVRRILCQLADHHLIQQFDDLGQASQRIRCPGLQLLQFLLHLLQVYLGLLMYWFKLLF